MLFDHSIQQAGPWSPSQSSDHRCSLVAGHNTKPHSAEMAKSRVSFSMRGRGSESLVWQWQREGKVADIYRDHTTIIDYPKIQMPSSPARLARAIRVWVFDLVVVCSSINGDALSYACGVWWEPKTRLRKITSSGGQVSSVHVHHILPFGSQWGGRELDSARLKSLICIFVPNMQNYVRCRDLRGECQAPSINEKLAPAKPHAHEHEARGDRSPIVGENGTMGNFAIAKFQHLILQS